MSLFENVYTIQMPTLSTNLLCEADVQNLEDLAEEQRLLLASYPEGFFLHVGDWSANKHLFSSFHPSFHGLMENLHAAEYEFVRFDACGDELKGMKTFGW